MGKQKERFQWSQSSGLEDEEEEEEVVEVEGEEAVYYGINTAKFSFEELQSVRLSLLSHFNQSR